MSAQTLEAERALKAKHRTMWSLGDYPAVAAEIIPGLGASLVEATGVGPGDQVLDVATGTGNAAIPAALAGAEVVGSDLTPELLAVGETEAVRRGARVTWEAGDAEALTYGDEEFDVVLSCVGVMFAPHHQPAADELVRVCRPGGRIGLASWTPGGFIGRMLATMRPFMPAPPPGAQPPPLWGDEEHVRSLLGDRVADVVATRRTVTVDRFTTPAEFRDYFKAVYGPTISAYRAIGDDQDRIAALDADIAAVGDRFVTGPSTMEWEYLLVVARRR